MNKVVIGWGAIDGGSNCRRLAAHLKDHEPELKIALFKRGMLPPLVRVITFTTIEDVNYFSKLLEEQSQDIKAITPVYVTGSNDKETTLEIQTRLAQKGAYVSYRTDNNVNSGVSIESIFSCGELAEELLDTEPNFKTHDYWVNRSRQLIYKMCKNQSKTHSAWLKEKALDIETMIDIYSRNTHYGKPSTLKAVNDIIIEICEYYKAEVNLESMGEDDKLDFALALVE